MAAGKISNPRAQKAAFSKKRKDIFRDVRKLNSSAGTSAAVIIISPTGERYAYGAVESAIAKCRRNDVSSDMDKNANTNIDAAEYEKRVRDLRQHVMQLQEKLRSQIRPHPCS